MADEALAGGERRSDVLDAAVNVFARFGYRKTSMDDVAKEAHISRPGLYFLFTSKSGLFREATERAVELDLAAVRKALTTPMRPTQARIVDAFDCWAGRYVGPLRDSAALIEDHADMVGSIALDAPRAFERLLTEALQRTELSDHASIVARTLISASIGIKHQAQSRDEYRTRMTDAVRLLVAAD